MIDPLGHYAPSTLLAYLATVAPKGEDRASVYHALGAAYARQRATRPSFPTDATFASAADAVAFTRGWAGVTIARGC